MLLAKNKRSSMESVLALLKRAAWMLCFLATITATAEKISDLPQPTGYVNDFAGVIDADSQQKMQDLARQVYIKAHATIEIVTVKSLDGEPIEDFATALEDKWHVGAKGTDKGLLMIFAISDRKRRIEVGYGLEGILNDAKVGDIGRSMVPQLKQGDYGAAILGGEQQIANIIAADAGVTLDAAPVQHTYHREPTTRTHFSWFGFLMFLLVLFFIFGRRGGGGGPGGSFLPWFLLGSMMNGGRGYGGGGYGGGGGFGGDDSGGSSGGSDSGGDFGGGFGGDSGGGGASGDW